MSGAEQRAAIVAVDEDPSCLATLERELRNRYGTDYDVWCEVGASAALRRLQDLGEAGQPVALVLAMQWMEEMVGTELLARVGEVVPTAKRGLLVAWGDRAAAEPILHAMSAGHFDYYLPRPGGSPDEAFHSVVTGFLADWAKVQGRGFAPIVAVGNPTSRRMHELRDLFTRNGLIHRIHPSESPEGRALLHRAGLPPADSPTIFVLGGDPLVDPTNAHIAEALAVNTPLGERFDVVIVGAGPAGLGAAVYGASEGLRTLVIEREALGGQASTSSLIRNYLGFPIGISGSELAIRAYEQAWLFGTGFSFMRDATGLRPGGDHHTVVLSDGTPIVTTTVVLAMGATYRRLGVPALEALSGRGVHYGAATSEAAAVQGQRVFIAGGGNSAGQAAIHLARYAASVTILVRGSALSGSMSEYLITQIEATSRIHVRTHVEVVGGDGGEHLEGLRLRDARTGRTITEDAQALFVMIGAQPRTHWLPPEILRDPWGYVLTGLDLPQDGELPKGRSPQRAPLLLETSVPGVFAAGDVRHRSIKRVASGVGEGSTAITLVHRYLAELEEQRDAPSPGLAT